MPRELSSTKEGNDLFEIIKTVYRYFGCTTYTLKVLSAFNFVVPSKAAQQDVDLNEIQNEFFAKKLLTCSRTLTPEQSLTSNSMVMYPMAGMTL